MARFFIRNLYTYASNKDQDSNIGADYIIGINIQLPNEVMQHIKALHIQHGEQITLFDGDGYNYTATLDIHNYKKQQISAQIIDKQPNFSIELIAKLNIYMCAVANKSMEIAIQKISELGAYSITPVISEYTQVKIASIEQKIDRWQEIAISSSEQNGRSIILDVNQAVNIDKIFYTQNVTNTPTKKDCNIICLTKENMDFIAQSYANHECKYNTFDQSNNNSIMNLQNIIMHVIKHQLEIHVLIGPEGGFTRNEILNAVNSGFIPICVSNSILRSETAAIAATSIIAMLLKE